ncbi:MAG: HtaA domain-containing protein [Lapillicoccus sp.]
MASLAWGVKASFVGYVRAVGGSVVADEGAYEDGEAFVFPAALAAPAALSTVTAADLEWRFSGRLTFRAHHGLLDVRIGDPWVRLLDARLELTVTDERGARVTVATGRGDDPLRTAFPVDLAPGAEHLFASTYPAGTPLAPLVLSPPARPPTRPPARPPA